MNVHNMSSHGDTHAKFGMSVSMSKDDLVQTKIHVKKYNLYIEVKGQGHTEVMSVTHHLLVIHSCIWFDCVKGQKSCGPNTKAYQKAYKFDLWVKGQHHIGIMNKRNTFSCSDRPMC